MVKVAIVDDSKIFRDGVKFILSDEAGIEIISESSDGIEFIKNIQNINADVVLMDIDMPELDGIETTKQAVSEKPDLKILALSMYGDEVYYYKMVHAGVKGFLIKEAKSEELIEAINIVNSGKNYFSLELLKKVLFSFSNDDNKKDAEELKLNHKELELFKLICEGMSDNEISKKLKIDETEVKKEREFLLRKTGTSDTANLIMYAIKNNIVRI